MNGINPRNRKDRYTGAIISTDDWITWEMRRYILATETPGLFGWYDEVKQ